jgi:hypothetical protein
MNFLMARGYSQMDAMNIALRMNPFRLDTTFACEGKNSIEGDLVQGQRQTVGNSNIISLPTNNTLASADTGIFYGIQLLYTTYDPTALTQKLYTYPNPIWAQKSTPDGNEDNAFYGLYNGKLSITSQQSTLIQDIPLRDALSIPQTQQLTLGTASTFANRDQIDMDTDGYVDLGGLTILSGDTTATMKITTPVNIPSLASQNIGVFVSFLGFIIRGLNIK